MPFFAQVRRAAATAIFRAGTRNLGRFPNSESDCSETKTGAVVSLLRYPIDPVIRIDRKTP